MVAAVDLKSISKQSISSSLIARTSNNEIRKRRKMLKIKKLERKGDYRLERIGQKALITTGIFIGEKNWKWNPMVKGYIKTITQNIHILDIEVQVARLRKGLYMIREIIMSRGKIFIVENNDGEVPAIKMLLKKVKQPYVRRKYEAGGISRRNELIRQVLNLETSKTGVIKKRLFKQLLKLKDITTKPGATLIMDATQGKGLIRECEIVGIRTIGCGSTSLNAPNLTYKWLGAFKGITQRKVLLLLLLQTIYDAIKNEVAIFKQTNIQLKRKEDNIKRKIRKINKKK